jgi:hypothetical protein
MAEFHLYTGGKRIRVRHQRCHLVRVRAPLKAGRHAARTKHHRLAARCGPNQIRSMLPLRFAGLKIMQQGAPAGSVTVFELDHRHRCIHDLRDGRDVIFYGHELAQRGSSWETQFPEIQPRFAARDRATRCWKAPNGVSRSMVPAAQFLAPAALSVAATARVRVSGCAPRWRRRILPILEAVTPRATGTAAGRAGCRS